MQPTLADLVDLETRVTVDDQVRALAALEDASALVRSAAGEDWLDDEGALETVPDVVQVVTLAVARRLYENPDGFVSETVDDYTYRLADEAATGRALYRHEVRAVRKAAGNTSMGSVELNGYLDDTCNLSTLANGGVFG